MAIAKRNYTARSSWAIAAVLVVACVQLAASRAMAQCVQTGSDVRCTGTDPDGFTASESDLTVTVEPNATVENGGAGTALRVLSTTDIVIEQEAAITATGNGARGVIGTAQNTLINRGRILLSGSNGGGVSLGNGSTFTNEATGQILLSSGIAGGGNVGVDSATVGTVINHGLIRVDGNNGIGVGAGQNSTVTNTGSILAPDAGGISTSLGQRATLENSGTIEAGGDGGIGVRLNGFESTARNRGTILGGDGTGTGVIFTPTASGATLVNESGGVIGSLSGVAIQGSTRSNFVTNGGTINGDVILDSGNDIFRWEPTSTLNGLLDGGEGSDLIQLVQPDSANGIDGSYDLGSATRFESLEIGEAGANGTWTITGSGDYTDGIEVVGGTAQFSPGTTVQSAVSIRGGTARLGQGTRYTQGVTVVGGVALLEPGSGAQAQVTTSAGGVVAAEGTSTLVGNLSFGALSSYRSTFDASTATRLDVQGSVDIEPNATLSLVRGGAAVVVRKYRILTATDGIGGRFAEIGASAFQSVTPTYGPSSGASFLDVLIASSFTLPATSPNEGRVGQHLNKAAFLGPSPAFSDFLAALDMITDSEAASDALNALHPEAFDVHTSASFETASTFSALLAERPLRCERFVSQYLQGGPSLEPCSRKKLTAWATGFGRYADRNAGSDYNDWSYAGGGLAIGVDHRPTKEILVTAMLGSSRVGLDFDGAGDGSLTTFEMGVAGAWRHGNTQVRGVLEYGHGWHETRRQLAIQGFERLALSNYESNRVTALVEASHTFMLAPFEIEPVGSLEYTYLHEESTKESNAGVVNLDVDSRSNVLVVTRSGLRAGMNLVKWAYVGPLLEWADGVWRPEIQASWRQVWNDYHRNISSRLEGAPAGTPNFRTRAQDAQYGGDLAASVSFQPVGTRNTISLSYGAFVGNRTAVHSVIAQFRMPL